jgi:hypothetical protein
MERDLYYMYGYVTHGSWVKLRDPSPTLQCAPCSRVEAIKILVQNTFSSKHVVRVADGN